MKTRAVIGLAALCTCLCSLRAAAEPFVYEWHTVANNGDAMPTEASRDCSSCHEDMATRALPALEDAVRFNSYNQPAVNEHGVVAFRARSRGGTADGAMAGGTGGEPQRGIFLRDLATDGPIYPLLLRGSVVPPPNNARTGKDGRPASFNEFPSVPRIDAGSGTVATRGQSTPVWTYLAADGSELRTGTSGIYAGSAHGPAGTCASLLGDVFEQGLQSFPRFQVPEQRSVPAGTGFDQFPGTPAVTERTKIVFKGNFTVAGAGRTGVFYRDCAARRGTAPVELIADSFTTIPGTTVSFGSTAPPSASGSFAVFAGFDDERQPTRGGIYRARLGRKPVLLETVVRIGDPVPGVADAAFERFGEAVAVSAKGRYVLFWGGWGGSTPVPLTCPGEGSAAMQAACAAVTPPGTTTEVSRHQGFFLRDMQDGTTTVVARTGEIVGGRAIADFVYWTFSGRVPGKGHGGSEDDPEATTEVARWRSSTFGAVSGRGTNAMTVVKARFVEDFDGSANEHGLLLRDVSRGNAGQLVPFLRTGDPAAMVDPEAPAGAVITALGIERDGFRGDWLAVNLSMLVAGAPAGPSVVDSSSADSGWAGVYAAHFLDDDTTTAD